MAAPGRQFIQRWGLLAICVFTIFLWAPVQRLIPLPAETSPWGHLVLLIAGQLVLVSSAYLIAYFSAAPFRRALAKLRDQHPDETHYLVTLDPYWTPVGAEPASVHSRFGYLHLGEAGLRVTELNSRPVLSAAWGDVVDAVESRARGVIVDLELRAGDATTHWWLQCISPTIPIQFRSLTRSLLAEIGERREGAGVDVREWSPTEV